MRGVRGCRVWDLCKGTGVGCDVWGEGLRHLLLGIPVRVPGEQEAENPRPGQTPSAWPGAEPSFSTLRGWDRVWAEQGVTRVPLLRALSRGAPHSGHRARGVLGREAGGSCKLLPHPGVLGLWASNKRLPDTSVFDLLGESAD